MNNNNNKQFLSLATVAAAAQQIAGAMCCALAAVETCGNRARQQGCRSTLRIEVPNKIIAATTAVRGASVEATGLRAAVVCVVVCTVILARS